MNFRVWENPWRLMLVVNAAVMVGVLLYKFALQPYVPYLHLLVDYHFGFSKRALIGAIVSLFTAKVPVWLVYALGGTVWLMTAALFVRLFRRTFGFVHKQLPLFVLMVGSPFFLKNFLYTLGHFDIYGCAAAICLLLAPARSVAFVLCAALASMVLILIHHVHFLMYVPTIIVIVVLRYYLVQGVTTQNAIAGTVAVLAIGFLFVATQFWGTLTVPAAEFVAHAQSRVADATSEDMLRHVHAFAYIWYQPLSQEVRDTWERMPSNLLGVPVFTLLICLHAPLWWYFEDSIRLLASDRDRRVVVAAIILVSAAYLVMFAMIFDYSRWISNWAVCLFLILHAVKMLPSSKNAPVISANDPTTLAFGWIVTLIPRVGIVRPF
ncbi:hypothetical protein J6524_26345 [Bradyrhizobium sp. WSM 1738]|uniref:hypothetical protein n=1 Tax=Bradyrhizobium hereditatis TaxID=2821405 RepID=UPI001CE2F546|nr:hypothetical protein [Bradyrhizobium hereditatis]MCA6118368.1 hypothetical protein [Bradyrhizobium hereditatis]